VPFKRALEKRGLEVMVIARDVGLTHDLLREIEVPFEPLGAGFGASRWRKVGGTVVRAMHLVRFARRTRVPDLIISTGRSGTLAARLLNRPSFAIVDYEHVDFTVYRLARSVVFFPDVIDESAFLERGIRPTELIPFPGIKEDISFSAMDVAEIPAHEFPGLDDRLVRVLVRPPSEESHYYASASRELTLAALARLNTMDEVVVILAPRHSWQVDDVTRLEWRTTPVILESPIQFVSLLKAADVVIAGGGTVAREAAYLGIPTYSVFCGRDGQVDLHLERLGRIEFVRAKEDLERLQLQRRGQLSPLPAKPRLSDEMADRMLKRTSLRPNATPLPAVPPGPGHAGSLWRG
jgi:predicted glycosyltransferase